MAFGDRKAKPSSSSRDDSRGSNSSRDERGSNNSSGGSKYSKGGSGSSNSRGGSYNNSKGGDVEWLRIGSITPPKKLMEENDDYAAICEALEESGYSFNLKIWTGGDDKTITLRNNDFITIKFQRGPKDKDFVLAKASLKLED